MLIFEFHSLCLRQWIRPVCLYLSVSTCVHLSVRTCPSLLQSQPLQDFSEHLMFAEVGQFHVNTSPQSGPQVGRTGEDVAQVFIPHELMTTLFKQGLNLPERETGEVVD